MATNFAGLTPAGALNATDLFWIEQAGQPRRMTLGTLRSDVAANGDVLTRTTAQDVTGLKTWKEFIYVGVDDFRIMADTVDGSHTRRLMMNAGGVGGLSQARGAYVSVAGVNHATAPGALVLAAGNGTAGDVTIIPGTGKQIKAQGAIAGTAAFFDRGVNVADATAEATLLNGTYNLHMHARLSAGSYNPLVPSGAQALIFTNAASAASNTGELFIGPWSSSNYGLTLRASGTHVLHGILRNFAGTVGVQQIVREIGHSSNSVPRWKDVLENDGSYSLWNYDTGGGTPTRTVNFVSINNGSTVNRARFAAEVSTDNSNAFRAVNGNYGAFFRNDGANFHLLFTASGDQYGNWNSLRPMSVNLPSGDVSFGSNVTVGTVSNSTLAVNGIVESNSATAALYFQNRTGANKWAWYCASDIARLWTGSADVLSVSASGWVSDHIGYLRDIPVLAFNGTQNILTSAHYGRILMKNNSTAATWTLVNNATDAYRIGCAITILNYGGTTGDITLARGSGVALYRGTTNANITVTPGTSITIQCLGANIWQVL